ncbi:MAG TPA: hypothetical protein VH207_05030 [Chthoniobacterales bacterium]|jgi:hypothetical protein|nr:hypothetical protein [Chthoniobacterales bacterium]
MRTLLLVALFFLPACHRAKEAAEPATPAVQQQPAERAAEVPESMQRQWTFLNRIRQDEAYSAMINRTMLNDQNEISVVLYSGVARERVPDLMRKVMTEMGQEFPHEDVTVAVYQFPSPPKRLGTAHLDGKTAQATYVPEK